MIKSQTQDKTRSLESKARTDSSQGRQEGLHAVGTQRAKPPKQWSKRAPPEHMQAPPEHMQTPQDRMHTTKSITAHTGQTGTPHRSDRWPFWVHFTPVRPVSSPVGPVTKEKFQLLKMHPKLYEHLLNVCSKLFHAQTSPPCWQCMNQAENAKNSTLGFSNRHRALKFATSTTMVKQDGAQFRNVIAVMMVKI